MRWKLSLCHYHSSLSSGEPGRSWPASVTPEKWSTTLITGVTPFNGSSFQLYSLSLPYHWLKDFFLAAASLDLSLLDDSLSYYTNLSLVGFRPSSYVTAQLALTHYHKKGDVFIFSVGDT